MRQVHGIADVLCYGTISMDNIIRVPFWPTPACDTHAWSDEYYTGGEAANVGIHLAAWGLRVLLVGNALGDDDYGRLVQERLTRQPNLDLRYVMTTPGERTPFCRILVTPNGERSIIGYWFDQVPKTALTPEIMTQARLLSTDTYGRPGRTEAAQVAFRLGRPVVAADVLWPDHDMLPLCDTVVNSAAALRHHFPGVDTVEHSRELRRRTSAVIITTDGPNPVIAMDRDERIWTAWPPVVLAVDSTGAGDTFKAGIVYARLMNSSLPEALRFACAAATLKLSHAGAATHPSSLQEIHALAEQVAITAP